MRTLIRKMFTCDKQRYLFVVETDGLELKLKCFEGASEKNESVVLKQYSLIQKKILQLINGEYGHNISHNVVYDPLVIDHYTRQYFNIEYPETEELEKAKAKFLNKQFIILDKNDVQTINYIAWIFKEVLKVEYRDELYFFTSEIEMKNFSNSLRHEIHEKEIELKAMRELITELDYQAHRKQ